MNDTQLKIPIFPNIHNGERTSHGYRQVVFTFDSHKKQPDHNHQSVSHSLLEPQRIRARPPLRVHGVEKALWAELILHPSSQTRGPT